MLRAFFLAVLIAAQAVLLAAPLLVPSQAVAQDAAQAIDYAAWNITATRAEEAIDAARASNTALEELRTQLVAWRVKFQQAQTANRNAIETTKEQISTLGPVPESGSESSEIAQQRQELTNRLSALEAPVKAAEVAYSRADGLIRGIDRIIRDRQASELMRRGPSPLNPANWAAGLTALQSSAIALGSEISAAWSNPNQRAALMRDLPATLGLLMIALVLLGRGRRWMDRWAQRVQENRPTAARWLMSFGLSLGQILLPLAGLVALTGALYSTGMVGLRVDNILVALPLVGFGLFSALWLGARIFPRSETFTPPLNLSSEKRREGRLYAGLLGLLLAVYVLVSLVADFDVWKPEARSVVFFPMLVLAGLLILRIGQLMILHVRNDGAEGEDKTYRNRLIMALGRVLTVLAVLGPVFAAIGYFKAAQFAVFPTVMSLQLLAFLLVLQRLAAERYVLISGSRDDARESLVPVLASLLLVLASAPLFALIWGARPADLSEVWTRFKAGFTIGEAQISPTALLTFVVVFSAGFMITRLLQGTLKNTVLPKTKIDVGGQNAIVSGLGYVGIFLAALAAITGAGIDLSSLAIVAGALSVGIGFGLQNIVSNFVSGIILLIERPISEGDWIEVSGQMGIVRDISVRSTRIETFDRTDVIVPNADLVSGMVTNWTRGNTIGRAIVKVGVAYGTDTKRVEGILREIAEAHPMVLSNPPPNVLFIGFGADSLDFEIRAMLRDVYWVMSVKSDINHEIARRFAEEKIEIPFAQRDIWLRNPEVLHPKAPEAASPQPAPKRADPPKGT